MNRYISLFIAVLFVPFCILAQKTEPKKYSSFIALKKGNSDIYEIGTKLLIKYSNDSLTDKVRGELAGVSEDAIFIKQSNKRDKIIKVALSDITLVKKIHPMQKIVFGIVGTTLTVGGVAVLDNGGSSPGSAMRGALLIPFIGAGVYCLLTVPATLCIEKINERKKKNGWIFQHY